MVFLSSYFVHDARSQEPKYSAHFSSITYIPWKISLMTYSRSRSGHGSVTVRSGQGPGTVRSGQGPVTVRSRSAHFRGNICCPSLNETRGILRFHLCAVEVFTLLECYAASTGSSFTGVSGQPNECHHEGSSCRKRIDVSFLNMERTGCTKMPVNKCQCKLM